MKKIFTLIAVMAIAVTTALADDNTSPFTFVWGHTTDGSTTSGDHVGDLVATSDGNVLSLTMIGTDEKSYSIKVDGNNATDDQGNAITGNNKKISYLNNKLRESTGPSSNALLQKITASGDILWSVWTDRGEVYNIGNYNTIGSYNHVVATQDGGAYMLLMVRHEENTDTIFRIHGANGTTRTIAADGDLNGRWQDSNGKYHVIYLPVLVKINGEGEIESSMLLWSTTMVTDKSKVPDILFYISDMTIDDDGNLYLCGNFRTTLVFDNGGMDDELTPTNVSGWDGSNNSENGAMFLIKYDTDEYVTYYTNEGSATQTYLRNIVYDNGKIYGIGTAKGNGSTFSIGSNELTMSTTGANVFVAEWDAADLTPQYAKLYDNSNSGNVQINNLQMLDGSLYATGAIKGSLNDNGTSLISTSKLHGFLLKLDPSDGSALAGGSISTSTNSTRTVGVFKSKVDDKEYINTFGYELRVGAITNQYEEDSSTKKFTDKGQTILISCGSGGITENVGPVVLGKQLIMQNRFGGVGLQSNSIKYLGSTESAKCSYWGVTTYSMTISDVITGISSVAARKAGNDNRIYTISGQQTNNDINNLPAGLYIQNGKKVVVK